MKKDRISINSFRNFICAYLLCIVAIYDMIEFYLTVARGYFHASSEKVCTHMCISLTCVCVNCSLKPWQPLLESRYTSVHRQQCWFCVTACWQLPSPEHLPPPLMHWLLASISDDWNIWKQVKYLKETACCSC